MASISIISDTYKKIINKGLGADDNVVNINNTDNSGSIKNIVNPNNRNHIEAINNIVVANDENHIEPIKNIVNSNNEKQSRAIKNIVSSNNENQMESINEIINNKKLSIYNEILQNQKSGVLPREYRMFSTNPNKSTYIKGSFDSVSIYHIARKKIIDSDNETIYNIIVHASKGRYRMAYEILSRFITKHMAIDVIDELQTIIARGRNVFCMENIFRFAVILVTKSQSVECVKIGLIIFELYDLNDQLKQVVKCISQSEEFTMFGAYIISRWENGNDELMKLANKVSGWGKINIVRIIEPSSEMIKQWILREGIKNDISPNYSAYDCYKKIDILDLMKNRRLTVDEFDSVCEIINALLKEQPLPGISRVENSGEVLKYILFHARKQESVSRKNLVILYNIEKWLEKADML